MMCASEGVCLLEARCATDGSYGAISGARTAATTKIETNTRPSIAGPFRLSRPRASRHRPRLGRGAASTRMEVVPAVILGVPDPRVDEGVADVHQQVHDQEDGREDEDQGLHHDVVVVLDRGHDP